MENTPEQTVAERHGTKPVPVSETETRTPDFDICRLLETDHAEFFKIMIGPDIVIALKEKDLHPGIDKSSQGRKDPDIAFRHHIPVLVPEIPDITKQIQGFRFVFRQGFEECRKTGFPVGRIAYIQAEMHVSHEIC